MSRRRLALAVLVLAGAAYWTRRYAAYRREIRVAERYGSGARPLKAGLTPEQFLQLGWIHAPPHLPVSSYLRRGLHKAPGTTRIGLFGCSFVEGLEAGPGYDPASLLEKRLRNAGFGKVEIVNFGTFAYGLHQSYLLWSYVGRRSGLDHAFFFPEDMHAERDESFVYQDKYATVHARYRLSDEGVELVPLLGSDRAEAVERYHALLTPWRYARFDYRPPLALRVLLPPSRRRGFNPFYYRALSAGEEIVETYARIFAALAAQGGRPVAWTHSETLAASLRRRLAGGGVPLETSGLWKLMESRPDLYLAPGGHLGPLGNDIAAGELYSFLAGEAGARATLIELSALEPRMRAPAAKRTLDQYDELAIGAGPHRLAGLARATPASPMLKMLPELRGLKAAALLTTAPPNAVLVPVAAPLEDGAPVFAALESGGETLRVPLGRLHAPTKAVGAVVLARSVWSGAWPRGGEWSLRIKDGDWFRQLRVYGTKPRVRVTIETAGHPLLDADAPPGGLVEFKPRFAELLRVRAAPDGYVDADALPARGSVNLLARSNGRWSESFPLFSYAVRRLELPPFATAGESRPVLRASR